MSIQCQDCGSLIGKSNFKTHIQTDKCNRIRELNQKYQYKCRKCGLCLEKQWHAETHVCDGVRVYDPEVEELRLKCKFYAGFIAAMGVDFEVDWEQVKTGNVTIQAPPKIVLRENYATSVSGDTDVTDLTDATVESGESTATEIREIRETVSKAVAPLPPHPAFVELLQEVNSGYNESLSSIQGLTSLLLKGERESADGEDRYYILGNKLGEFISREYPRQPDSKIVVVFAGLQKLIDKIINTIDEREQFVNGLNDSFCGPNIVAYTLINLGMFDQSLQFDPKPLLNSKVTPQTISMMSLDEIVKSYSLVYAMLPIDDFINTILIDRKTVRYCYAHGQFYRQENSGYIVDPWMLDLTMALSNAMIEVCTGLFRKAYKTVFSNNVYRDGWMSHPFLKQFVNVYKNIEIASTVFDLNHLMRKKVMASPEGSVLAITPMKTSQSRNEEWALMSTRINAGIPGFEMTNFFETIFDAGSTADVSAKWLKKYLGGLKVMASEYTPSSRFKLQVSGEAKQYEDQK